MAPTNLWMGIKICTSLYVRPEILCAQLLLHPLVDFVHTHTQWPTWHGDDCKDWILRCYKVYMSYGTFSWFTIYRLSSGPFFSLLLLEKSPTFSSLFGKNSWRNNRNVLNKYIDWNNLNLDFNKKPFIVFL